MSNRRLRGPKRERSAFVKSLHEFFDQARDAKQRFVRRFRGPDSPPRRADPKWGKQRAARAKAWRESESERAKQVAGCIDCHEWFRTFQQKNWHRAFECPERKRA